MPDKFIQASSLASSLCTGAWERTAIAERLARLLPPEGPDPVALMKSIRRRFYGDAPPPVGRLAFFLVDHPLLQPVFASNGIRRVLLDSPVTAPMPGGLVPLLLPVMPTVRDVSAWLCLTDAETSWFSDTRWRQGKVSEPKLHHYYYSWLPKRTGGFRLIEAPKSRLKEIQRQIVEGILGRVPPHDCAHGFTRNCSVKTFTEPHLGQQVVLRFDLKDFFHSVPVPRIAALFRRLGYPLNAARILQGFCTNIVSADLAGKEFSRLPWEERKRLQSKHLPQGAPTSAPLANLCAWRLDCRLQGLADRYGYQYTRYADDLAFSGDISLARRAKFIETLVGAIAREEGFRLNHRKTRLRLASQRQRLAGVVVNQKANYSRTDWDILKAILYNCVKHGSQSQNRDGHPNFRAHLEGRVAHVAWLNPARGKKLQDLLKQISW